MYIQGLLNLLPLASLPFNSYQYEHGSPKELGNLSPYYIAPAFPVKTELPDDCSIDRVMLVG